MLLAYLDHWLYCVGVGAVPVSVPKWVYNLYYLLVLTCSWCNCESFLWKSSFMDLYPLYFKYVCSFYICSLINFHRKLHTLSNTTCCSICCTLLYDKVTWKRSFDMCIEHLIHYRNSQVYSLWLCKQAIQIS